MRQYPSDISREEYELIREVLESARKKTQPRKYALYDVFCAVILWFRAEFNGECCQAITQGDRQCITISEPVFTSGNEWKNARECPDLLSCPRESRPFP